MRTIFARFQNLKLGKFDEDGMVASDVRKALAIVNIELMKSETEFRDFNDVMQEVADGWGTYTEAERSALATAMSGTRQREKFLVLMNNWNMAMDLSAKATDSNGLALERYDSYLESTEAKLNQFKATLEGVYIKTLNSDTINNIIEAGTAMLKMVDAMGGFIPMLGAIGVGFGAFKNVGGAKKYCSVVPKEYIDSNDILMQSMKFRHYTLSLAA